MFKVMQQLRHIAVQLKGRLRSHKLFRTEYRVTLRDKRQLVTFNLDNRLSVTEVMNLAVLICSAHLLHSSFFFSYYL